ncbi:molybdenum cofactor guanylyltransferase MobA [Xylophilus sp. GOD-11R]|uniref:molybdenum cofactor guanylyltransferase MobA n=1 Tax=Xylophilus sp. GOD-11R TaxID=3089814 RepID=UPI00298CA3EB|nr:molybdenum cofactor guanylyltransferase MobA [Xylophilus sp. GOD-11R]WPB58765.1 molybdenum cofactor guanylyltransferase MobA [Xylophilus sp. GOD-11R]
MPHISRITGLVLAGGRGSRMAGADKGLVTWQGEPLAARALRRLRPQVGDVAINANRHLEVYQSWNVPVWPDADDAFAGPLAGLLAGLSNCRTDWLATVPCDSPLFPADLVARLAQAADETGSPIAMAQAGGAAQPVFLLVNTSLREELAQALSAGEKRVRRWASSHGATMVDFDDSQDFANVNTAEELAALPPDGDPIQR